MKHSDSIDKIAPALISAKKQFSKAKKSGTNTHLSANYANLTDVLDAVEPALNEHGLMVSQYMLDTSTDASMHLATRIIHESGQWMEFQYNMPIEKKTAQAYGSTTSYARRYALAAVLSITQTDDDAEVAKRSVDDFKIMAQSKTTSEELRSVYTQAKGQLSPAEFKIIEPFLLELSAKVKANTAAPPAAGFNPNKPNETAQAKSAPAEPANKKVDASQIDDFS